MNLYMIKKMQNYAVYVNYAKTELLCRSLMTVILRD